MLGPGESLRQVREAHAKTIEEMAEATGIRLPFLAALEQEAFDSLPGRGFGKLYIRAYAEVLGFDPRPVIEAYDRAVRGTGAAAPDTEPPGAPRPVKDALARWRRERIAARVAVDPSEEPGAAPSDRPEAAGNEPEPEHFEEPARTVPPSTDPAEEPIAEESIAEEPMAVDFVEDAPAPPLPVQTVTPPGPARSRRWLGASLTLLVLLPPLACLVLSRSTRNPRNVPDQHELVPRGAIAPAPSHSPPPAHPQPPQAVEVPRTPPRTPSPVREQATPSALDVAESGVGLRLVGTRLEGEGDRFLPGQRVTFTTRILGGGAGEHIFHVWLRDGKVEQSIRLRLGGASWHTYSTKTLWRPGAWAVEARDEQGRVLARADLTVAP